MKKENKSELDLKVQMHKDICSELTQIYRDKNKDYGDSFSKLYDEFGMNSSVIRIFDKVNRLKTLTCHSNKNEVDESINDTLRDLANYCIMTLIERNLNTKNENSSNFSNNYKLEYFSKDNKYEPVTEP